MKTKHCKASIPYLITFGMVLIAVTSQAQPANGANKYLGNITTKGRVRSDFLTYWNQITPENESKWSSVEGTRGRFNWGGVDSVKNFAEKNKIPWKFHTLVWGGQYPGWMDGLSQTDQLMEVTKWFDSASVRYPNLDMIDVCNESNPSHNPPKNWKNCLGGDGTTGFDWIIKSFQMARQRWPHALLKPSALPMKIPLMRQLTASMDMTTVLFRICHRSTPMATPEEARPISPPLPRSELPGKKHYGCRNQGR